jgi:membrane dipeptidase
MKKILFVFFTLALFSSPAFSQSYKKLHEKAIVIDTHNDFISTGIEKGKSFDQNLKGITHSDLKPTAKSIPSMLPLRAIPIA